MGLVFGLVRGAGGLSGRASAKGRRVNRVLKSSRHGARMVGFALPKLRWLVLGAVGAGVWAMTQEPPTPRKTPSRPAATVQRKAEPPVAPQRQAGAPSAPKQVDAAPATSPKETVALAARPSQMVTNSVAKPQHPLPQRAPDKMLYTTTRVNMRGTANASAPLVATLGVGEAVKPIVRDGKWQLVSARGHKGWILAEYLRAASPEAPRPATAVPGRAGPAAAVARAVPPASARPQAYTPPRPQTTGLLSSAKALFGGKRPLRAPQAGDCQCPYDLMIDGSQCGERSAYSRRSRRNVQCYM